LDGSHATDRLQVQNIEHLSQPLAYDVVIYISGGNVIARKASDGAILASATNSTAQVPDVFQAAFNYYATVQPKPITVVVRPGIYEFNGGVSAKILPFVTVWGYGATLKQLAYGASMIRGDPDGGALATRRENINILGLTFDFNYLGQELNISAKTGYEPPRNILVKDCIFKNIKDARVNLPASDPESAQNGKTKSQLISDGVTITTNLAQNMRSESARSLYVGGFSSVYNPSTNVSFIDTSCDATIPSDTTGGEYAVYQFASVNGGKMIGNSIANAPATKEVAYYMYSFNQNIVFSNNIGYNNDSQYDLTLMQVADSNFVGNVLDQTISSSNVKNVTISNNCLRRYRMAVYDKDTFDASTNLSGLRTSNNLLISGNSFDSSSSGVLGSNIETIDLEYAPQGDGTNPFRNIAVVGNQAKSYRQFFHLLPPQDDQTGPNQNIVVANNHCVERELNDNTFGLIVINGNTTLSTLSEGYKNVFVTGNYIGPLTTGAAGTYRDVAVTTTAMQNLVFRDNWFNSDGFDNAETYTLAAHNYGDATTRRYTNSGVANISSATSVTVTHGVEYTPAAQDIYITPTTPWGGATKFWVDNRTATTFQINCSPSATISFAWQVSRKT